MTSPAIRDLLRGRGVDASVVKGLTVDKLALATADGSPSIIIVEQGKGFHAVVVDGVTTRKGVSVVAVRDPWGAQYFEEASIFPRQNGWRKRDHKKG